MLFCFTLLKSPIVLYAIKSICRAWSVKVVHRHTWWCQENQKDDGTGNRNQTPPIVPTWTAGIMKTAHQNRNSRNNGNQAVNWRQHKSNSRSCQYTSCITAAENATEYLTYNPEHKPCQTIKQIEPPKFWSWCTATECGKLTKHCLNWFCKSHSFLFLCVNNNWKSVPFYKYFSTKILIISI